MTVPDPARAAAAARLPDRIAFIGFGLIGGSIALALRESGHSARLAAWTPNGDGPAGGLRRGLLDVASESTAGALDGAGLVILAGPPLSVISTLGELGGALDSSLADGATITDVASTKRLVVEAAQAQKLRFVGGHPMAGRETSGVGSATSGLFVDRAWVIVPSERATPTDTDRVEALAVAVGARPTRMTAAEHDAAVAAISHLPLVLAASLVEGVATSPGGGESWPAARLLAASGWADMTRLARGDPEMGAGILATNAGPVAERLHTLRGVIDSWLVLLDDDRGSAGAAAIHARLEAARRALQAEPGSSSKTDTEPDAPRTLA